MKMLVETFEVNEIVPEGSSPEECDSETRELVKKLGLEGQERFVGLSDNGDNEDPGPVVPYARMSDEEVRVYSTLFSNRCKVHEYKSGLIPLRVLQVLAYVRESSLFEEIEVWSHPDKAFEDPLLVGVFTPCSYSAMSQENFLLARWGTALASYEKLRDRAVLARGIEWKAGVRKAIAEAKAALEAGVPDDSKVLSLSCYPSYNGGY